LISANADMIDLTEEGELSTNYLHIECFCRNPPFQHLTRLTEGCTYQFLAGTNSRKLKVNLSFDVNNWQTMLKIIEKNSSNKHKHLLESHLQQKGVRNTKTASKRLV